MREQEGFEPLAGLTQILADSGPCAGKIAECLVLDTGYVDGREVARAQGPDQLDGIAPVGLDPLAGFAGDQ
ncbi:hypothetical protein LMG29542_08716 [Paraburkholderia humisilvae]|uniref:Uncharacterized protein n=1 Tax=Paraburkholderia humisilvae TaxID=627669 RepID=A0A6J5FA28_9BURK|nr:hypothetical protein LMG29542_08716 [Paraburkholderia humisilvae]